MKLSKQVLTTLFGEKKARQLNAMLARPEQLVEASYKSALFNQDHPDNIIQEYLFLADAIDETHPDYAALNLVSKKVFEYGMALPPSLSYDFSGVNLDPGVVVQFIRDPSATPEMLFGRIKAAAEPVLDLGLETTDQEPLTERQQYRQFLERITPGGVGSGLFLFLMIDLNRAGKRKVPELRLAEVPDFLVLTKGREHLYLMDDLRVVEQLNDADISEEEGAFKATLDERVAILKRMIVERQIAEARTIDPSVLNDRVMKGEIDNPGMKELLFIRQSALHCLEDTKDDIEKLKRAGVSNDDLMQRTGYDAAEAECLSQPLEFEPSDYFLKTDPSIYAAQVHRYACLIEATDCIDAERDAMLAEAHAKHSRRAGHWAAPRDAGGGQGHGDSASDASDHSYRQPGNGGGS